MSLIDKSYAEIGLDENAFSVLIAVIPYQFYAFLALATVPIVIFTRSEYGPMKYAQQRHQKEVEKNQGEKIVASTSTEDDSTSSRIGIFLYPLGMMLLTLPVVTPVIQDLGYDLVWFGVIMVKFLEIGLITPPVGLNVYILKGVVGDAVPLETIFKGIMWFLAMDIVTLALLIAFPEISLWLPTLLLRS